MGWGWQEGVGQKLVLPRQPSCLLINVLPAQRRLLAFLHLSSSPLSYHHFVAFASCVLRSLLCVVHTCR